MKSLVVAVTAVFALCSAPHVGAQVFPSKPLRVIVPFPAGGGTDTLARLVSQKMSERLGQPVIVENRSGASGNIGTQAVVKSPADGYTLLFNNETLTVSPNVSKNVPYDLMKDLVPIGQVAESFVAIGVHQSVPANSLRELIALAKAQPGKLSYSSCGNGTMMHLAGELLKLSAGIDMVHVPYRGCAPALQDSAAGLVPVFVSTLSGVKLEKQGKVKALAVGATRRSTLDPNVPTVAESGFPSYEATSWMGMFAPAGLPPEVHNRLVNELRESTLSPDVSERIRGMLYEPRPVPPKEFSAMLRAELARWAQVAKAAKIEVE
jgi:tripartite-type tricarboxylate transporter receptor subunit TctC